jgi:hypothetical protein
MMDRMTAALLAQNQLKNDENDAQERNNKTLAKSDSLWQSIKRSSTSTLSNVAAVTKSILKWGTLVGTAAALGSAFGIDRLARGTSDVRRESMGLGMSTGAMQSFNTNFGRVIDTSSFLNWVNSMETDITKQAPAQALLHRGLTGDTGGDAVALLKQIRGMSKSMPVNQLSTMLSQAYGVNMAPDELRRIQSMSGGEFNGLMQSYQRDKSGMNIDDATGRKWQDFSTQIDRAKTEIFKVFVQGLAPLTSPLTRLSQSIVHLLQHVQANGTMEKAIDKVSAWIDNLGKAIDKPDFMTKIDTFIDAINTLADDVVIVAGKVHSGLQTIGWVAKNPATAAHDAFLAATAPGNGALAAQWALSKGMQLGNFFTNSVVKPAVLQQMAGLLDKSGGLPAGLLEYQKQRESGSAWYGVPNSSAGAVGPMQMMPDTSSALGINPNDPAQALKGAQMLDMHALERFHGDVKAVLASYNIRGGEGAVDALIKKYGKKDYFSHLPKETQSYVSGWKGPVQINIVNATGGNAVASVSGLAH